MNKKSLPIFFILINFKLLFALNTILNDYVISSPNKDIKSSETVFVDSYEDGIINLNDLGEDNNVDSLDTYDCNNIIKIALNNSAIDLFPLLKGTVDSCGIWLPPLNSGTSLFNPAIDHATVYSYAGNTIPPRLSDSATVTISIQENDCDNDGVRDNIDLDDDNDGILDTDEGCISSVQSEFKGTFGTLPIGVNFRDLQNPPGGGYNYSPGVNGLNPNTTYSVVNSVGGDLCHSSDLWQMSGHTTGDLDDAFLAVNGSTTQGVFFNEVISVIENVNYTYGIWHSAAGNLNLPYSLSIRVTRISDGQIVATSDSGNNFNREWRSLILQFTPTTSEDYRFELLNTSFYGGGNDFVIDDISVVAECFLDNDLDGIPNSKDLDSDNDGITDVIESGGIDANGDGLADDDDDNVDNTASNGIPTSAGNGTIPINTDNAEEDDYLDIDADNDGIQDNIEAQSTLNYIPPSGIDINQNGIDDAYDVGINLIIPINTDADAFPDYLDLNSDNDCLDDNIEAYDLNQDGVADILASGMDTDNDGLDNIYDSIILGAATAITNPSDGNEVPNSFPDLHNIGNDRDFREEYETPNAGTNGNLTLCNSDAVIDLFDSLGGNPNVGGTWTPPLASGSGIFNPAIDLARTYTYTFIGIGPCTDNSADVVVNINSSANAGEDGTLSICASGALVNLFTSLGGNPDAGGIWTPPLASGTGVFDPAIDTTGSYTYTVAAIAPCVDDTANVVVTVTAAPNAGEDNNITLCSNDNPINLFDRLGGNPDVGGTWTPPLASGSGVFDPTIDPAGTYTYTVNSIGCDPDSSQVVVAINPSANAGEDGTLSICASGTPVNLFTSLGGNPDAGGIWTPPLASGTGVFDPAIDTAGNYTYTVAAIAPCVDDTANVVVTVTAAPNAGEDNNITLCNNDNPINLFDRLGGNPDVGGIWTPPLASGSGVFDPTIDPAGTYTYTVNSIGCDPDSSQVVVAINPSTNAGEDGALSICASGTAIDLFNLLGGNPDAGGIWTPPLASGTGVFDPAIDPANTYTYTVAAIAPCLDDTANVVVTVTAAPNAGEDANATLCINDDSIDLFDRLGGNPDTGGTWTPPLASGTGVFDPAVDTAGTYTYTVNFVGCEPVSSEIVVVINPNANAGENGTLSICASGAAINLFTRLGGNPGAGGIWTPLLASGTGVFDPAVDPPGTYTYTIAGTAPCEDDTADVVVIIFDDLILNQPNDLVSCDDDNDNSETFNLEQQTTIITIDNVNYIVTYHINQPDAITGANPLMSPYTNIANPQTIYTRVVNSSTGCFDASINFDIRLEEDVIANNDTYEICDDNVELDGDTTNDTASFDLNSRNAIILGPTQAPANFNMRYYLTQNDADNGTNPLASPFTNTINTQTIFARVENNTTSCFATSEILLRVNPLPAFTLEESYTFCLDANGTIINDPPTIIDTGLTTANYSFEWFFNGAQIANEMNGSIVPMQAGNYSVTVTDTATNCSASADTVVLESTTPVVIAQQVSITLVEDNTILATADSNNATINTAYEFKLNNGPWVSNTPNDGTFTFEDVPAGEHIISARDSNGCGIAVTSIVIIDYIPYFTPNGDGFHDTWNITGIENQPDAVIYIFNRYGKLLKQLKPNGTGWNGIYNGELLPTNDYWFTLNYRDPNTDERKEFKAHFVLKR